MRDCMLTVFCCHVSSSWYVYFISCTSHRLKQDKIKKRSFIIRETIWIYIVSKAIVELFYSHTGRFPVVVLTYVDEVNEEVLRRRWTQFQSLHCSRVFAIKNYNIHDYKPRIETDNTIVDILYNCCITSDQVFLQTMEDATCTCC